ncbi:hypothetical protein ACFSM5_10235 [Lacibacterium aquatile]|uniref:Uncharacterized protein n=1 Tax=Lacibacterium aquatile TaxID=1168082 RepID=A0ABW5DTF3_9PROT
MKPVDMLIYVVMALVTTTGLILIKKTAPGLPPVGAWASDPLILLPLAGAAFVYFSGLGLWVVALARNPLSIGYPVGIGLSLVSSTLGGMLVLGEPVGLLKFAGLGCIIVGAVILGRSKADAPTA